MKAKTVSFAIALVSIAVLYGLYTWVHKDDSKLEQKACAVGVEGYIYGYPLVLMNATKQAALHPRGELLKKSLINTFLHSSELATPAYNIFTSPNVDTLYSNAWLDLSSGPLLLTVPKTTGRYFVMEMLDAWTNVFADPGTRLSGSDGGQYLIVSPNWQGEVPQKAVLIRSSTNMAWINLRIECFGPHDYEEVRSLQDHFILKPLNTDISAQPISRTTSSIDVPPEALVSEMDGHEFFATLQDLLTTTPPTLDDAPVMERLASINIYPEKIFQRQKFDPAVERGLDKAVPIAQKRIHNAIHMTGRVINGWRIPTSAIGTYGVDYLLRAAVASWALGVNLPEDAIYPFTFIDVDGNRLHGSNTYRIHFAKGETPPVNAFWSITMYDAQHYLVENQMNRYAIQSHNNLQYNVDGSLDIFIQKNPPQEKVSNWLPSPQGDFNLILRMYWPKSEALDGTWAPPAVELEKLP